MVVNSGLTELYSILTREMQKKRARASLAKNIVKFVVAVVVVGDDVKLVMMMFKVLFLSLYKKKFNYLG